VLRHSVVLGSLAMATAITIPQVSANEQAKIFGAMPAVHQMSLSPDGNKIAFISPGPATQTDLYSIDLTKGNTPVRVTTSSGDPENLSWCGWVSSVRLACNTAGTTEYAGQLYSFSNVFAVNTDGSEPRLLTKKQGQNALGYNLGGGNIIDWLPDDDGSIMMSRYHLSEENIGTRIAKTKNGLAAEIIDTMNGRTKYVERPSEEAVEYITDGIGHVRVKGMRTKLGATELDSGAIKYFYELDGKWLPLGELDYLNRTGFNPYAVDPGTNRAFGFQPVDGRKALVAIALDGSGASEVIVKHDRVDVDGLIRIGRKNRVVGASYALEKRIGVYFDSELSGLASALGKALGEDYTVEFSDADLNETKLLIWGGSDVDPGQYFLFDKTTKQLRPLLGVRPALETTKLGRVKPVTYPAVDGTKIPGYLTLPPGSSGKNLPAIVMPHGGPDSRDEWGFDWLAQFYVSQGFAVLQPNYRGSDGYGDEWYEKNGFQSWRTAIGDVIDAGKWLVAQGIAKPSALSIVGWSYGGYAALQSAVVEPNLFKAVVAIAPVTDLSTFKNNAKGYYDAAVVRDYVGNGPHISEGSPAQNASQITAPVMLFHGDFDRHVEIQHSKIMEDKLKDAGKSVTFVEYKGLTHGLRNSAARIDMLSKSAAFLPK